MKTRHIGMIMLAMLSAAVAVSPVGADGTALQVPVPVVVPLPCAEAADEPSPSAASTT